MTIAGDPMLRAFKALIEDALAGPANPAQRQHTLQLAAAALLLEVSRADHAEDDAEQLAVVRAIKRAHALSDEEISALVNSAEASVDKAASLQEFTRVLNEQWSAADRAALVEDLWRVAYADGRLDKYEEYMIRKIADLLYVPHSQFIRAKLNASAAR
jgi:uncharacterized tellurite resistance protein B-like protein